MNRREALRTLAAGSAAGALAAGVVIVATPVPVTAEPIGAELVALIERHRAFNAELDALGKRHGDAEEAAIKSRSPADRAAFKAVDDAFNDACERTTNAMDDIVAAPIATLADMRAKAVYLARIMPGTCEHNGAIASLLASMGGALAAPGLPVEPDPFLALDAAYRQSLADYEAMDMPTGAAEEAGAEATYRPHYRRLCDAPPTPTTFAGALAAVRLAFDEEDTCGHNEDFTINTLRAALAYFDGRA